LRDPVELGSAAGGGAGTSMNSAQRRRLAARFAQAWKRRDRTERGREHRQDNLEARKQEFAPGISTTKMMLIFVGVLALVLIGLRIYR